MISGNTSLPFHFKDEEITALVQELDLEVIRVQMSATRIVESSGRGTKITTKGIKAAKYHDRT